MASPGVVPNADVLSVLRGFDPDVEEILASSGHVSLYTMAVESQQWTRKDVEGSLFLLKRRGAPRFRMMVLNKLSTENYFEDIHGGLDFELNPPYLMYTHGNSEIIGVWFYEQEDLHRIENVLMRIKQTSQQLAKPAAPARAQSGATRQTGGKADDDNFYDKPVAAAVPSNAQAPAPQHQPQPQLHGPPAAVTAESTSNLATLLRNATLKQQQQQQSVEPAPLPTGGSVSALSPQLLPPSFFSQQHRPAPSQPLAAGPPPPPPQQQPFPPAQNASPQAPVAVAGAPQPAAGPQGQARVPQLPVPPQAPPDHLQPQQPQPGGPVMGGALAKLFANAHKPAPAHAPAQPQGPVPPAVPPPPPSAAAPAPAVVSSAPVQHGPAAGGAPGSSGGGGGGGLSDEERVRRLLARIATNDALVKLLAVELRAVGLL